MIRLQNRPLGFHIVEVHRIVHLCSEDFIEIDVDGIKMEASVQEFDTIAERADGKDLDPLNHGGLSGVFLGKEDPPEARISGRNGDRKDPFNRFDLSIQ